MLFQNNEKLSKQVKTKKTFFLKKLVYKILDIKITRIECKIISAKHMTK